MKYVVKGFLKTSHKNFVLTVGPCSLEELYQSQNFISAN